MYVTYVIRMFNIIFYFQHNIYSQNINGARCLNVSGGDLCNHFVTLFVFCVLPSSNNPCPAEISGDICHSFNPLTAGAAYIRVFIFS